MGFVNEEEELELGAGSLGLGFGRVTADSRSSLQLQWQQGGDGSILSSRGKPQQADVGNVGGGGFISTTGLVISSWYTPDQWRELQRQAMIYKHMAASVPIPADLLRGLWPPQVSDTQISATRIGGAGYHGGPTIGAAVAAAVDPEPGRCRRTDGKKWRCANEAAHGKRYCEKHLHRSRPRSRKPVERQQPPHVPEFGMKQEYSQVEQKPFCPPPPAKNEMISSWSMDRKKVKSEEETTGNSGASVKVRPEETMRHLGHGKLKSEPQWQQPVQLKKQEDEKPPQVHQQQHPDNQTYYPYASYQHDDSFFSLLNSDISSLNERHLSFGADPWSSGLPVAPETNKYIDFARSSGTNNSSAQSPPVSMVPDAAAEEAEGLASAGLNAGDAKRPPFWWLADALLTGSSSDLQAVGAAAQLPIADKEGGGVVVASSPPDSAVASPSGVLQRPLASISDCSSNNSSEAFGGLGGGGGGGGTETTTAGLHTWMMKP